MYTPGSCEGTLRPPSNPRLPRRCRSIERSGAQPPNPRNGTRTASRRTVATRVPQVDQALVGLSEALRLPTLRERANEAPSGL
ncbi:MAG: hypothetical protein F4115_07990 [Acidobacteria bacterium]|nr:hypothetical protein [Acidobacteriota bacterium]